MAAPTVTPLDAERERLRAKGWNEAQIEEILIRQEVGGPSQQPAGGAPVQVPMSGVLGNLSAVLSHAGGKLPVLTADLANLSNSTAGAKSRGVSALKLLGAAGIIAVICFAVYQEWQIHIVYAPEIQRLTTEITGYETEIKRLSVDITGYELQIKKLSVDLTTAQNQKAQAEAKVAPDVAAGEKAKGDAASFVMDPTIFGKIVKGQQGQDAPADSEEKRTCVLMNGQRICSRPDK